MTHPSAHWPVIPLAVDGEETVHFRPPRRRYTEPSVLMTLSRFAPMIDMSFLLLVFFITTTRFAQPEGVLSSQMPAFGTGGGGPAVALPLSPIVVRLSASGPDGADCTVRVDRFERVPSDLAGLTDFLGQLLQEPGFDGNTPLVIVAEDAVRWDHVVNCWNAAIRAGCKNIGFSAA